MVDRECNEPFDEKYTPAQLLQFSGELAGLDIVELDCVRARMGQQQSDDFYHGMICGFSVAFNMVDQAKLGDLAALRNHMGVLVAMVADLLCKRGF